jgi:hypothetical protein
MIILRCRIVTMLRRRGRRGPRRATDRIGDDTSRHRTTARAAEGEVDVMHTRPTAVVLFVLALVLTGFAGASPAAASQDAAQTGPQITQFRSAHFEMTIRFESQGVTVTVPGTGDFEVDPSGHSFKMRMQMTAVGESFEMVIIDQQLYVKSGANSPWEVMDLGQMGGGQAMMPMASMQPMMNLERIATFRQLGPETIDGTATTKWSMMINSEQLAQFIMLSQGMMGGQMSSSGMSQQEMAAFFRNSQFNGELWIANDTGYLRRMHFDMRFTAPSGQVGAGASAQARELHLDMVITFSRYNEAFNIVAPAGAAPMRLPNAPTGRPPTQPVPMTQMPRGLTSAAPMTQMPRGMTGGAAMPQTMPRTGEPPLWPIGGLGLLLAVAGVGARRLGCQSGRTSRSRDRGRRAAARTGRGISSPGWSIGYRRK